MLSGSYASDIANVQVPSSSDIPNPAGYMLNFLWLEKNIAVSVDQVFSEVGSKLMPHKNRAITVAWVGLLQVSLYMAKSEACVTVF